MNSTVTSNDPPDPRKTAESSVPQRPEATGGAFVAGQLLAGRFRIVRPVAKGGMGIVYEAFDEKLQRRIALKCAQAGHAKRLTPEVRHASDVHHPNICRIFEIHTDESNEGAVDFVTMEFLEGGTLTERLKGPPLSHTESREIAAQLCAGLAAAHRQRIIHGDLKSSNVILATGSGGALRAVITDFGLARAMGESGVAGGSPGYMAPEILRGAPSSVAADVYALGVILHELKYGMRPDQRAASDAPTRSIGSEELPPTAAALPPKPLVSRWDAAVRRCLDPDPARRFPDAESVAKAIDPLPTRKRLAFAAVAIILVAVTALTTYFRSTAPGGKAMLSIASIQAGGALEGQAAALERNTRQRISSLKGNAQTAFAVVSGGSESEATHRLEAHLEERDGQVQLRADLVDKKSGARVANWTGRYSTEQLRYAPVALAGVVTGALHLPAPQEFVQVNSAVMPIYRKGLALARQDSTLDNSLDLLKQAQLLDIDSALPYAAMAEVQRRKYFLSEDQQWLNGARASLNEAEIRNPDCAEVHRIAGLLENDAGRREAAFERFRRAIEFPSANSDGHRRFAQLLQVNGQYAEAQQNYRRAAEIEPDYYRVHQDLGSLYFVQANYAEAVSEFQTAVRLAPGVSRLYASLADSYVNMGQFAEAEAQLREAIRRGLPDPPLLELGHVLMYERRESDAIPYLLQSAAGPAASYFDWMYLGLCYETTGQPGKARAAFQRGLKLAEQAVVQRPRSGNDRAFLGYLCARNGDASRAQAEIAQAMQLSPNNANAIWMTALTYELLKKRERALEALNTAPRALLEDLKRWPEAAKLTADAKFNDLLSASRRGRP